MKKLISAILFCLLITLAENSNAQVNIGVKAGMNFSKMISKDNSQTYSSDFNFKPGLNAGLICNIEPNGWHLGYGYGWGHETEYPVTRFGLQTGLLYSMKGYGKSITYQNQSYKFRYNIDYLEVPLNVIYRINPKSENFSILLNAGPYIGFAINGKMQASDKILAIDSLNLTDKIRLNIGSNKIKDDIKLLDYGVNFGVSIYRGDFYIQCEYGMGLANVTAKTDNNAKAKNWLLEVTIGINFLHL